MKRVGESYFTDVLRFLFDKNGYLINGQCQSITFDLYANNVFHQFDFCHVSFEELSEAAYNQAFGINPDGTIYFDSRGEMGMGEVYASAFTRGDHSGTIEVLGEEIAYECIKVQ